MGFEFVLTSHCSHLVSHCLMLLHVFIFNILLFYNYWENMFYGNHKNMDAKNETIELLDKRNLSV